MQKLRIPRKLKKQLKKDQDSMLQKTMDFAWNMVQWAIAHHRARMTPRPPRFPAGGLPHRGNGGLEINDAWIDEAKDVIPGRRIGIIGFIGHPTDILARRVLNSFPMNDALPYICHIGGRDKGKQAIVAEYERSMADLKRALEEGMIKIRPRVAIETQTGPAKEWPLPKDRDWDLFPPNMEV